MKLRKMKWNLLLLMIVMVQAVVAKTPVEEYGRLGVLGKNIVDSAGNPVQLRGMSFYWSQWQGKYYTYNTVKWLRDDWKCTIVRAAMGIKSNGTMNNLETEKAKVKVVVDAAIDLGIYVIIDWHSHTALDAAERVKAAEFFTEMAKEYGKYPNVIYEPFNEPLNVTWANLKAYHQVIVDSIRRYDTTNIVVCGTPNWSQDVDKVVGNTVVGKNIAYTLHYYAATHKESLRTKAQTAMKAGLCLMVTEFGTCDASGGDPIDAVSSKTWFEFMDDNKISWCNWSVAEVVEAASIVKPGASENGGWTSNQITKSGNIIRTELLKHHFIKNMTPDSKPIITSQPVSASVGSGTNLTLSVEAFSPDTLKYQWYFNGTAIANATGKTQVINGFTNDMVGNYWVKVINNNGDTVSDTAKLSIIYRSPYKTLVHIPGVIEAENFDEGGNGYTYYDTDDANRGGKYRTTTVDIEASEEANGFQVGYLAKDEWLEYTVNVDSAGDYTLNLYVASTMSGGILNVRFGTTGTTSFTVPSTGSWTSRTVVSKKMTLASGEQVVRFTVGNATSFNIDKLEVVPYKEPDSTTSHKVEGNARAELSPNPARNTVTIKKDGKATVAIFSAKGEMDRVEVEGSSEYSVKDFASGVYYFQFITADTVYTRTLIKE